MCHINNILVNEYLYRFCFARNRLCNIKNISNITGHVCDISKTLLWIFVKSLCIMGTKRLCSSLSKHAASCSRGRNTVADIPLAEPRSTFQFSTGPMISKGKLASLPKTTRLKLAQDL